MSQTCRDDAGGLSGHYALVKLGGGVVGAVLCVVLASCSGDTGASSADCHPGADVTVVSAANLPQATGALIEAEIIDAAADSRCDGAWSRIRVIRFHGGHDPDGSVELRPGTELRVREQGPVRTLTQIGDGATAVVILEGKDGEDWKVYAALGRSPDGDLVIPEHLDTSFGEGSLETAVRHLGAGMLDADRFITALLAAE